MDGKAAPTFRRQVMFFGVIQYALKLRALATVPILSRVIGAEGYGTLSALLAYTGMAQMLFLFGIPTSLMVFIPWVDSKEKRSREFWMVAQVMAVVTLAAVALMACLSGWALGALFKPGFNRSYYFLALALVPLNVMNAVLYSQIMNNRQARPYARLAAIAAVSEFAFLLTVVWFWKLGGVLLSSVLGQAMLFVFMAGLVLKENPFSIADASMLKDVKKYYVYSASIVGTSFAAWVIDFSDRLIISRYRPVGELGVYQVSYGLCMHTVEIATPLFAALIPFVASAVSESKFDSAREYLEKSFKALLMLFAPLAVFFSLEARDMLVLLSTPQFYAGAAIVPWVISAVAIQQFVGLCAYNLHAHKKGALIILSSGFAAALNVGLNFAFVPKHGIIAAAVSTTVAYALQFALLRFISGRFLKIGISAAHVFKVGVCAAAFAAVIMIVSRFVGVAVLRLGISFVLGGGCYAGLLLLTRAVSDDDRTRVFAFVGDKLRLSGRG